LELVPQLKTNLDLSLFVNKIPDLKSVNLQHVIEATYPADYGVGTSIGKEKPNRTRIYALTGVFLLLMLVLGYVIYSNLDSSSKVKKSNVLPKPSITRPKPTNSLQEIPASTEIDVSTTSSEINISTPSSTTGFN
jgi:hypothetical protein